MRETTTDHVEGEDFIYYYTSEKKYLNKLRRQIEAHPDDVVIKVDDGHTLGVKLPASWFKAPAPPAKRAPMTEEQREAARERMKILLASQKKDS